MSFQFDPEITDEGILIRLSEVRLMRGPRILSVTEWPGALGKSVWRPLQALIDNHQVTATESDLHLPHATVPGLPHTLCLRLGLPDLAQVSLALRFEGRIDTPTGRLRLDWTDENHRSIRPSRRGAILVVGSKQWRLSQLFYELCEAAHGFNATEGHECEERIAAWAPVRSALDKGVGRHIAADGYAQSLYFYQAGAFALDVKERADGPDFTPILMRRVDAPQTDDEAPADEIPEEGDAQKGDSGSPDVADVALPSDMHQRFLDSFERNSGGTRDAYVVGNNAYVIIPPDLKIALDVVRAKRRAPTSERRAFLRNPRAAIADALEIHRRDVKPLFVETAAYSERVQGLGVWEDISLPPTNRSGGWLPEAFDQKGERDPKEVVTAENVDEILRRVEAAEAEGQKEIEIDGASVPIADLRTEIEHVRAGPVEAELQKEASPTPEPSQEKVKPDKLGLVITTNIDGVDYQTERRPRTPLIACEFPYAQMSSNRPKEHQLEGFAWLLNAWRAGWPGVLLADDMGLGKTYQALAFLVCVRQNLLAFGGHSSRRLHATAPALGPMMIVAPTSLLRNWQEEAERHLTADGLGVSVEAYGTNLRSLKRPRDDTWTPEDALDLDRLRSADWILTTYETLADNHRAFARIPYSVVVFDEMQKIKEPGSINTRSAGTLNVDFVLGLTGTPIENRIEDLWSLFDRLAPGYLGALRKFSERYGGEDRERLAELKRRIDTPVGDCPAPLLRRMKDKARDGLPDKIVSPYKVEMPPEQAKAYECVVADATGGDGSRRHMLEILHRMRGVSLHPRRADDVDPSDRASVMAWLAGSARLSKALEVLREIAGTGEKALVFVEDLAVQRAFAEAMATVFDLEKIPGVINGAVAGERRQDIVKRFQEARPGFDLLLLSPKAAGVGLTITAANHVLHLSRWWNPAVEDQCNDRAYRIGQTRDVTIYVPLALHPIFGDQSFDVKLDELLGRKRELSRDMLVPPEGDGDLSALFTGVTT